MNGTKLPFLLLAVAIILPAQCFAQTKKLRTTPPPPRTETASAKPESGKYLTHRDGVKTYYRVIGAGKGGTPLFVLHGGPGFDHQYFLGNQAFHRIARDRPVIFYDQRGSGKSSKLSDEQAEKVEVETLLRDLDELVHHLGYKKVAVAGHSWGGFLAMAFAWWAPEDISHLILIDSATPLFFDTGDYIKFREKYPKEREEMSDLDSAYYRTRTPEALRAYLVAYMKMLFYSPRNRDRFIEGSKNYTFNHKMQSIISGDASMYNLEPILKKIDIPTLVIHGRHDYNIVLAAATEKIVPAIPGAKLVVFEQSGHLPFYEEPEKFVREVNGFLSAK